MKLLMFDLDGTLLNEHSDLNPYTKEVLEKVHNAGVKLGIATGRPVSTVEKKLKLWGMDHIITIVVGMNGSHIKDLDTGYFKHLPYMPAEGIDEVISLFSDLPCEIAISDEENLYMSDFTFFAKWISRNDYLHYTQTDFSKERKQEWAKLCVCAMPEFMPQMIERLQQFKRTDMVGNLASRYTLEFTNSEINKGVSIRKLCVGLGISMDEVMAFGDANNDLRMLEAVGYPVAMINGTDEVKAIAKDITKYTNVEDGVAKYIEEHFNEIVGG